MRNKNRKNISVLKFLVNTLKAIATCLLDLIVEFLNLIEEMLK